MSSPQKTFLMNGVSMPTPKYEYDNFEDEEDEGADEDADDSLIGSRSAGVHELNEEDYEGYEEDYTGSDGEAEDEALRAVKADVPPAPMPTSFYNDLDSFLSRPAPKINVSADGAKAGSKKKRAEDVTLPRLGSGGKDESAKGSTKSSVSSKIRSKVNTGRALVASGVQERSFDPALLQEAFAYADRIQREVGGEDDDEAPDIDRASGMPVKSGSAPQLSKPQKSNNGVSERKLNPYERQQQMRKPPKKAGSGKSSNQSKEGVVKRLRSKTAIEAPDEGAFSNISASGLEHTRNKGGLDYNALVQNFENGTTLQKLKAELAASRQSMAESENFMKQMSLEYSKKKRR